MNKNEVTVTGTETTPLTQDNPKQLSGFMIMVFVALIASFPPLSTDLYLPALPTMSEQLNCSVWWVNLSISIFFIFVSTSSFIWGPLSDKYGRKRMLLIGVPLFIISSIFCMFSQDVYQLIIARIFQAIGAGASMAVNLAIVKDVFPGKKRESTLAMAAVLNGMIPVIAPSIGSLIIRFSTWRGIFGLLTIIGILVFIFTLFLKETNEEYSADSSLKTTLRLFVVLKNPHFYRLLIVFSIVSIPLLAFIGVSSFIFVQHFGLSAEAYSIYFGAIAAHYIIGGPIYLFLRRYFRPIPIITASYVGSILSGILILTIGEKSPMLFAISVALGYLCVSIGRPPSNSLLLEQQDKDTGSASSLIQAVFVLTGAFGMMFISIDWSNRIMVIGIMNVVLSLFGFILWQYTKTRCRIPKHFLK
ncbi:MAG: multidrug effflux MFS transporter [Deltaproteobacteria bacterium]|nr:multidrug effflux MFS transporter [Deltaproteobacteria bacterium]